MNTREGRKHNKLAGVLTEYIHSAKVPQVALRQSSPTFKRFLDEGQLPGFGAKSMVYLPSPNFDNIRPASTGRAGQQASINLKLHIQLNAGAIAPRAASAFGRQS